jgi:hypothetical protein
MSNLLAIETAFLSLATVKQSLNLSEIRSTQRVIANGQKKKFEQTLALSKLVVSAVNWFSSDEGKQVCAEEGITWTNEEIGNKIFGWQKSFFYKVVKCGKLETTVIDNFNAKCTEIEAQGSEANRSLEGLLKFAKQVNTATTETTEGEGEQTEPQPEIIVETIFTMTYKNTDGKKIALRIDANGTIKTTNNRTEIAEALAYINSQFN